MMNQEQVDKAKDMVLHRMKQRLMMWEDGVITDQELIELTVETLNDFLSGIRQ